MKNYSFTILSILLAALLTACNDFFETNPTNIVNDDEYIENEDEVYRGFLGILNRVQEAGDHAIFLCDTRSALLETTENAPIDLQAVYNYDDLQGNDYANPRCYYSVIIACNDYIKKMEEYKQTVGGMTEVTSDNFPKLISATLRLKVWAYLQLGRIYGEAYWFDEPLNEHVPMANNNKFQHCNMKELADKAISLLENGITVCGEHISADLTPNWYTWLNEENPADAKSKFPQYQFLITPAVVLNAEFRSWRASYVDEAEARGDWEWIRENVLQYMYSFHSQNANAPGFTGYTDDLLAHTGQNFDPANCGLIFQLTKMMQSDRYTAYFTMFFTENYGNAGSSTYQNISSIIYDYDNGQYNRIVQYFCPSYPDAQSYYLKPSEYALNLYPETDIRGPRQKWVINNIAGKDCVSKYYYGYNFTTRDYNYLDQKDVYRIMPAIPLFRGHDLHFLLAEAEAHLGHFQIANYILNDGFSSAFADQMYPYTSTNPDPTGLWDYRYRYWALNVHEDKSANSGGYADLGIAGVANGTRYNLPLTDDQLANYTNEELLKMYDWAIAEEHQKEYIAEGKSYSYLCKIADRYANPAYRNGDDAAARSKFADLVAPKYQYQGKEGQVRSRIQSNGYWIKWNLE